MQSPPVSMVEQTHPMWVNMLRLFSSHCFAKPKSHSFTRPGFLPSSNVLSSFRSLKTHDNERFSRDFEYQLVLGSFVRPGFLPSSNVMSSFSPCTCGKSLVEQHFYIRRRSSECCPVAAQRLAV